MGIAACSSGCLWKEQNWNRVYVKEQVGIELRKGQLLGSCNRAEIRGSAKGPRQAEKQESEWETMILWVKLGSS